MSKKSTSNGEDQAYFLAIEKTFVELRGAPLLLSPEDWQMAREWRCMGIPVQVVEEGIAEVFRQRKLKARKGRVNSLRYCRAAVEKAWRAWKEIRATTITEPAEKVNPGARLQELADALPAELSERQEWQARILSLEGSLEDVEERLAELDRDLLQALESALGPAQRRSLEEELESALVRLAERVGWDRSTSEETRAALWKQLVRRQHGLPVLSLFGR
jgi:hypothetical protein